MSSCSPKINSHEPNMRTWWGECYFYPSHCFTKMLLSLWIRILSKHSPLNFKKDDDTSCTSYYSTFKQPTCTAIPCVPMRTSTCASTAPSCGSVTQMISVLATEEIIHSLPAMETVRALESDLKRRRVNSRKMCFKRFSRKLHAAWWCKDLVVGHIRHFALIPPHYKQLLKSDLG